MYSRAVSKLQLTSTVIEEGRFSLLDQAQSAAAGLQVGDLHSETRHPTFTEFYLSALFWIPLQQLSEILKFGIDKLLSSDESSIQEVTLEKILGPSRDGQWVDDDDDDELLPLKEAEEEAENTSDSSEERKLF